MPHKVLFRRVSLCFEFHHDIERYQCIITMYRSPFYVIIYIRVAANFLKWSCFYGLPGTLSWIFFLQKIYTRTCVLTHGRPQAWARGGTCPLWKCCKVFLCINISSKTLSRRIILHYFHNLSSASGTIPHRVTPTGIPSLNPAGDSSPDP